MNRQFLSFLTALGIALFLVAGILALRTYQRGITINLGDDTLPALPPPPLALAQPQKKELLPSDADIQRVATSEDRDPDPSASFFGPRLGAPGSRLRSAEALRELMRLRQNVEVDKKPSVPLEGKTVPVLAQPEPGGAAVDNEASPWSGPYASGEAGTLVITDPDSWARSWRRVSAHAHPVVDFKDQQIVAVFLGYRSGGGFRVEISSAVRMDAAAMTVFWKEVPSSPVKDGATSPFAMRQMPRTSLPVRFEQLP